VGPNVQFQVYILKFQSSMDSQRNDGIQHNAWDFLYLSFLEFMNAIDFVLWAEVNCASMCVHHCDVQKKKWDLFHSLHKVIILTSLCWGMTNYTFIPPLLWKWRMIWTVQHNILKIFRSYISILLQLIGLTILVYIHVKSAKKTYLEDLSFGKTKIIRKFHDINFS
jgi:hypothetical protein